MAEQQWFHCLDDWDAAALSVTFETRRVRRQQRFCVFCLRVSVVRFVIFMLKKAVVSADTASMTMTG